MDAAAKDRIVANREDEPLLAIDELCVRFGERISDPLAVDRLSFEMRRGEFVSVIGPSGCGKSTLFNVLCGLLEPTTGRVKVNGVAIRGPHPSIGVVFGQDSIFPWRTVLDNVALALELRGVPKAERRDRARRLISFVGLGGFERRFPGELPVGMRQRVAIARALAPQPEILLMDEPFAALDEQTRLLLGDRLLQIQQQLKQTTLLITRSVTEAVQLSDRVLVMSFRPGRIRRIVPIDLPRPRTSEIVTDERFGRCVAAIWSDLRQEAMRAIEVCEDAGGGE